LYGVPPSFDEIIEGCQNIEEAINGG